MKISDLRAKIKPWMLPIAMAGGILMHDLIDRVAWVAPYLIFVMLLITYCRVDPRHFRLTALSGWLLAVQMVGALGVYFALLPFSRELAEGTFICIFCPTATAAPVITGMLGGSVARLATFSIVSNMTVAITAPLIFALMGSEAQIGLGESVGLIATKVVPLLVAPLLTAFALRRWLPRVHGEIAGRQTWSFYIWAVSLFIVVGRSVSFVMAEPPQMVGLMAGLALSAGVACCLQFWIGRKIGARHGDKIAGAQGLGQKNTVLAIWMALTYLAPISSVAPAAYIAWQNTINSIQLYLKGKRDKKNSEG